MQQEEQLVENQQEVFIQEILNDYKLACLSRECSLLGRKEVLTGKAKFGIFGDGKELAQIAMAKQFQNGDFRSGYYRDQTFMMAIGALTPRQFFAGVYAHTDLEHEPMSAGRQMGGHFATPYVDENGEWLTLTDRKNSSSDISPTAGQMPRLLGLAQASKVYRNNPALKDKSKFSIQGNEVAFGTIGDASTSEGLFWETMNAAGVLQVPMVMSVWDDGYGISVPKKFQTTKGSISEVLKGLQREEGETGYEVRTVKGWDYPSLITTYEEVVNISRTGHVPCLIHVQEVTQPQGHSTSGSHERYKTPEQLQEEIEKDCITRFKSWILEFEVEGQPIATEEQLDQMSKDAKKEAREAQKEAWSAFLTPINNELKEVTTILAALGEESGNADVAKLSEGLGKTLNPIRKDIFNAARKAIRLTAGLNGSARTTLKNWIKTQTDVNFGRYSGQLYSETKSPLNVPSIPPQYDENPEQVDGRLILRDNFREIFIKYPEVLSFGEDVGKIGGVNQSMEGMQDEFGEVRVSDTGIREATILGQAIGMSMRGLRPIAEIQYLDYVLYALQIMSDDLATVHYRSAGQQIAPAIISTRGHRLEGIWHSGSPMGTIVNALRGMHICVPRNMTTAAGFYNTLLQANDPAMIIEPLNGYRSKEPKPNNLGEYCIPLGEPEITRNGADITLVSYGSTFNICTAAAEELATMGIDVELVDIRTLLPFDLNHVIKSSLSKTNRLLVVDEDVSSGGSAYILEKVMVEQKGYEVLDSTPETLSAKDHRPPYSSDGDYFSKPSQDDIVEKVYAIMHEVNPAKFPAL